MRSTPWKITKKQISGKGGIVACQHWKAAEAGVSILESGGNAVDAAVAAALVLDVVEPLRSGIGGGGYMVAMDGKTGEVRVLDFSVCASSKLRPEDYPLEEGADGDWFRWPRVRDGRNLRGYTSVCVPGAVAGLAEALRTLGTIPWSRIIEPAISEAAAGMEVDWVFALNLAEFREDLLRYPESVAVWLPGGNLPPVLKDNKPFRLPLTAKLATLERLQKAGPDDFYSGELGHALAEDLRRGGSPVDMDDLLGYRPIWKDPLRAQYRGWKLSLVPGNSAGPSLARALASLEASMQPDSPLPGPEASCHYARACREEYAYRLRSMGESSTPFRFSEPSCTSNLCVVDRHGNVVALTNTILNLFGSKVTSPSLGTLLNNGLMWFDPVPGHPNSIAPGVRPLTNMSPFVAVAPGGESYGMGAAGGRTIFPTLLQLLSYVADYGMSLEEAFLFPRLDASTETIRVSAKAPEGVAARIAEEYPVEIVLDNFLPSYFSYPSAVCHNPISGVNTGMAHHMSPWPAAAAEDLS